MNKKKQYGQEVMVKLYCCFLVKNIFYIRTYFKDYC